MKFFRNILICLFALGSLSVGAQSLDGVGKALVYKGPGSCVEECSESAALMATRLKLEIRYVGPGETDPEIFKGAVVWIQPGGESRIAAKAMAPALKNNIREFVRAGGAYVGFCAGMFLASELVAKTDPYSGLGLFTGKTVPYDRAGPHGQGYILPATLSNGTIRQLYFEDGPMAKPEGLDPAAEVTVRYADGGIAGLRTTFGKGRVNVIAFHPEAPASWRNYFHLQDPDGLDYDLASAMIRWAIRWDEGENP